MQYHKKWLTLFYLVLTLVGIQPAVANIDAQEILKKSDNVRNPDKAFSLITTLISYKSGKQHETSKLVLYSLPGTNGGQFRSLLRFISPQRDAGKLTLKSGRDLWLYDPNSQASVPISPQQRLLGQASNGDVVTANWAADYQAEFYAVNGSLLKTTYYRRYEEVLGGTRATEAIIIDGVNSQLVTVVRNQNFTWRDVPEAWLQRDFLPHFKDD